MSEGKVGTSGRLDTKLIHLHSPGKAPLRMFKVPGLGHLLFTFDKSLKALPNDLYMRTDLKAHHFDSEGRLKGVHKGIGGLTTQAFALALVNESTINQSVNTNAASPLAVLSTPASSYMASGTAGAGPYAYDYTLATPISTTATASTSVTLGVSADNTTIAIVGTLAYGGSATVTEWGLFPGKTGGLSIASAYNTSANAFTGTSMTPTASPTWTLHTWAGLYIAYVASIVGFITDNSATALTIGPAWVNQTSGGGSATTPSANTAVNIYPWMADHKLFTGIAVVSGDSIQYTYTLTCASGG